MRSYLLSMCVLASIPGCVATGRAQPGGNSITKGPFFVTVDSVANGRFSVTPSIPEDGRVPAGTILTLEADPDAGFALDSLYYY